MLTWQIGVGAANSDEAVVGVAGRLGIQEAVAEVGHGHEVDDARNGVPWVVVAHRTADDLAEAVCSSFAIQR